MITIRPTDEEQQKLDSLTCLDFKNEWKYMKPFYYKKRYNYFEIYSKDEYEKEINKD